MSKRSTAKTLTSTNLLSGECFRSYKLIQHFSDEVVGDGQCYGVRENEGPVPEGKLNNMVAVFKRVTIGGELRWPFCDRTGLAPLKRVDLMGNRGAVDQAWLGNQESFNELSIEDRPNLYFERSGDLVGTAAVVGSKDEPVLDQRFPRFY